MAASISGVSATIIRGRPVDASAFQSISFFLPETIKVERLQTQPVLESEANLLMNRFKVTGNSLSTTDCSALLSVSHLFSVASAGLDIGQYLNLSICTRKTVVKRSTLCKLT